MANFVIFPVNDTSPTILYSPFADTLSTPNLSAGWNPYYTLSGFASVLGEVGDGTSLHITSNNGSFLVLQWNGTGIQLFGNATLASYSITLDGAPFTPPVPSENNVLATISGLPDAPHTVVLTALIPTVQNPPNSSLVVFESAIITSSPEPLNVSFSSQALDDDNIAFLGRWTFDEDSPDHSFHSSHTLGDRAIASFNGTTLLLRGITSPNSGNYTVTVDNVTTILSAQSSFTSFDSLLFYATGLDSTSTHVVQVTNSGGDDLSLLVGGFITFVPCSTLPWLPSQTSPNAVALASGSFPRGTIAAITLAGILTVLILSGLIFYFIFYRPRKRRRVLAECKRSPKEHEAGVLDIRPEADKPAELGPRIDVDRDSSVRNGFSRWIRGAVEGSPGELGLPIRFRHSDSLDEKFSSPLNEVPLNDPSDRSINSSIKRKGKTKNKGKARQVASRSWTPGKILDISSRYSRQRSSAQPLPSESLDYVSTFIAAEPTSPKGVAPPSYAASVSIRDSKSTTNGNPNSDPLYDRSMPSVPHSVSPLGDDRSYLPQKQDDTGAFLLPDGSHFEQDSSAGSSSHRLKLPPQATPMGSLTRVEQGNAVEGNMDVTLPTSSQHVVGSPRAIRHPYASQDEDSVQTAPSHKGVNFLEDAALTLPRETLSNDNNNDDLVEVRDGIFLSVCPSSPFQLTFDTMRTKPAASAKSKSDVLSYLSTSSSSKQTENLSGGFESPNPDDGTRPLSTSSDFLQGPSNQRFRLTPTSIPPTSAVIPPRSSNGDSEGMTSFLDFSSSREGSLASRSMKTTSEERQTSNLYPPPVVEKSRWSNTTVPSVSSKLSNNRNSSNSASGNGSSDSSRKISEPCSIQSSTIPIRVSMPPSSCGNTMGSLTSRLSQTADNLHVHPPFESLESPTESIPMSAVSELHFRQSVSEENIGFNSRRTTESSLVFVSSHPPLPTRHDDFMPRPFDPSILVSRVLGLSSPTPSMTAHPAGCSNTAVLSPRPFTSLPNLFTSRHITNIHDENSGTDSLGP